MYHFQENKSVCYNLATRWPSLKKLRMSRKKDVRILTHGEVQKKILANPPKIRPKEDQVGPMNRYKDENFEAYNQRKRQFFEACKKYNRLNQETLITCKQRLIDDYIDNLDLKFLVNTDNEDCKSDCHCENRSLGPGQLVRKRTQRPIHQVIEQPDDTCCIDSWFKRYLKLNRFIWAARTIILKNRLLKVLELLKTVTPEEIEELEKYDRKFLNVSYAEVFERFL